MIDLGINEQARQSIRDSLLAVEVLRAQILPDVQKGRASDASVHEFPVGAPALGDWVMGRCEEAQELLAVSPLHGPLARHRRSFDFNVGLVSKGVRMLSLFDAESLTDETIDHLIGTPDMPYYLAYGPSPIKVFDRHSVLMNGPAAEDRASVMLVSRPEFVAAALRYVETVRRHAVPAREFAKRAYDLTHRQHTIARLLSESHTDEDIARLVRVSVRTVRSDIATLMQTLGASTRFAAGVRYARIAEAETSSSDRLA